VELDLGGATRFVPTQEALASQLGVNRKSVERWMKKAGCPGKGEQGWDVRAWEQWIETNKLGRTRKATSNRAKLEEEKIRLHNERQQLVNAKMRGESLGNDEVCKTMGDLVDGFVLALHQCLPGLVEETAGLPLAEALKRSRRRIDEVLGELALGEWAQKKTFWSTVSAMLSDRLAMHGLGRGRKNTSTT
jgi:hypothetical protein